MTQPETQALFRVISNPRDLALFALVYHYGLRVSEVTLLERDDIDFDRRRLVVKRVKGGVWCERPLFASSEQLLSVYVAGQPMNGKRALFPGRRGPLKKRQIQALFVKYRTRAGLPSHLTCHSLRHSIATHLLDAGMPLEFVQDHLGHRSIRSTTVYARITDRHRDAAFRQLEKSPWIVQPKEDPR